MVDKKHLESLLSQYFRTGQAHVEFEISQDGKINAYETIPGFGVVIPKKTPFPHGKLPFEFGECKASLVLDGCGLTSLQGCPRIVHGRFTANFNPLPNLVGGPVEVKERIGFRQDVPVRSLEGFPLKVGAWLSITYHRKLPLLRALACQGGLNLYSKTENQHVLQTIEEIFERYKGQPMDRYSCQKDLIEAGFEDNAKW